MTMQLRSTFLLLFASILITICNGQDIDPQTGRITYTGVVQVEGASADQLFSRATLWYASTFKSAGSAIDLSDRASGVIVSAPGVNFPAFYVKKNGTKIEDGVIKFSLKIECREGRFKYTLTNLEHANGNTCSGGELERASAAGMCFWNNLWASMKAEAHTTVQELVANLQKAMSNPQTIEGSDW
jgi:hypothetical protein